MNRRKFLRNIAAGSVAPILLNSMPFNVFAANSPLMKLLADPNSDRILVLLQMHGGNDGLNMLVPIEDYSLYQSLRANIAIPEGGNRGYINLDNTLPLSQQVGVHPDMTGVKELFDEKRASIIHSVGYENMNLSHFRARDIWYMGGDYEQHLSSGWMGRFLEEIYPGYPDSYPNETMPDPLGLEMGYEVSLAFTRQTGIPGGISIANPQSFYDLINSIGVQPPTSISFPDNRYGEELKYLTLFEEKTHQYAARLKEVYENGHNDTGVTYPGPYPLLTPTPYIANKLGEQFKIIARLISGGIKTRIFLTQITGFDTHAGQVEETDPTQGRHAALLYHVSEAVRAFHDDLLAQGLDNKVLTMAFSEFGRRVYSNASYGTDHGKAGPIMMFGGGLKGGIIGNAPDLNDLDNGNLKYQFDYRQVYTSVLSDWLGSSNASITNSGFGDFLNQKLDLFTNPLSIKSNPGINGHGWLGDCFPNPASDYTEVNYKISNYSRIKLKLFNSEGKLIKTIEDQFQNSGEYKSRIDLHRLSAGNYIVNIEAGGLKASKLLVIK